MNSILTDLSSDLAEVSAGVLRSLVQVRSGARGVGSGAIWHSDGLILTNAHVVSDRSLRRGPRRVHNDAQLGVVLADGQTLPARVLAIDEESDLAALRVDAHDLPAIALGDSRRLRPGDFVMALGFPWGVPGGVTTGIVIGAGAELPELSQGGREWIAASLHLRPGHSGGPLVDVQGRLVGINTMMSGPDAGVAIPVHVAAAFLKQAVV
jgi:serine protease Do